MRNTEEDFLRAGFKKTEDRTFPYRKELVSWDEVERNDLDYDHIPAIMYGYTGINSGFCVYTGSHFIWLSCHTPDDAVEFASRIVSFEPV